MSQKQAKRTAKASIFEDLFSDENNLLELYRVLHPEDKTATVDDLTYVTIKNIITTGQYNDLGFMARGRLMILVEAQSTWSVNIILRGIMYLAETWNRYFRAEEYDIYSSAPVPLPEPELYVIYTGGKEITKKYITLSEEFFDGRKVAVDASVRVLKYTGGSDIIDQYIAFCKILDQQRKLHPEDGMKAINETIRICLEAGVLTEYLRNRKEEVVSIMLSLYSQEQATEMMQKNLLRIGRQEGRREGRMEGRREGRMEGRLEGYDDATITMINNLIKNANVSVDQAMAMLSIPDSVRGKYRDSIQSSLQ